jgi:GDP-L-fucose synthase
MMDLRKERICVTGGAGFVGRVVCRLLAERGVPESSILPIRRQQYELTKEADVARLYAELKPTVVLHLAAEVGGIGANMAEPGRYFFANAAMGLHLIEYARRGGLKKFVQTGTVCAYPKFTPVPFKESDLWNGYPEETNAPYGIAKKALFVMLDGYKRQYGLDSAVVLPVNLFGPHDDFDLRTSHVIPALIRKCETARKHNDAVMTCWGTGAASREFLYVDDAAEGIIRAAEVMDAPEPINLGSGREVQIRELVEVIAGMCGYKGRIEWDTKKPDGQPRRCLDTSLAKKLLGWSAKVSLEEGMQRTIDWWRSTGAPAVGE